MSAEVTVAVFALIIWALKQQIGAFRFKYSSLLLEGRDTACLRVGLCKELKLNET
jgi:hypothetical protein